MTSPLLALLLSCDQPEPYARARVMNTLADGIGGPKALAKPGDFILENEHLRVAITQGGASMGPSLFGGSLIDADLTRLDSEFTGGRGNDRFAEMFPTVNMNVARSEEPEQVFIVNDGADGQPAVIRAVGESEPFLSLLGGLWIIIGAPDFAIYTDYIVEPGKPWVTLRTTAHLAELDEMPVESELLARTAELQLLDWAIETGMSFGDFYLQGGSVDVFAPGIGFHETGAVWDAEDQGINTFEEPFELDFVAGTADGVSYGIAALDGELQIPLFTSSQTAAFGAGKAGDLETWGDDRFPPGSAFTYQRIFVVGHGDVGSVLDAILEARGAPVGRVSGQVRAQGSRVPVSGASILVYKAGEDRPYSQWESDVSWEDQTADGSFGGTLPPGDYELVVREPGMPSGQPVAVTVTEGSAIDLALEVPRAGVARFRVVDERGEIVPSKVSIFPATGQPVRDPILGDSYIGGSPEAVVFNPLGEVEADLPPGDYVAYATRGFEYELGVAEFTVQAASPTEVEFQVWRSVDTTGWISADFHVHAQASHDSGVSPEQRVFTMMSEHVEFVVSSDHDFIVDYRPVIERLGVERWIHSAVGLEVTTIEVGHFLGFPLEADWIENAGGAPDWTGMTPDQMLNSLRELGDGVTEPVTFVAHPRDGILGYFDEFGWNPYSGNAEPGLSTLTNPILANPSNFSFDYDALELLNGKRFDFLRTPTQPELDAYANGEEISGYEFMTRPASEQQDLIDGVYPLGYGRNGQIDDWFTLLNLGYRYTALGNSDTHGTTSTESGCPRNFVFSTTDDPAYLDAGEVAEAVRRGNVITSYGPFVRFTADNEAIVGEDHVPAGETVSFAIEVQSPSWFDVDRVELYRNGTLVAEWAIETPNADVLNLSETWEDSPDADAWYVVMAFGDDAMDPLFTPVEHAPTELQDVVTEALSGIDAVSTLLSEAVPVPRQYPVYPMALTNPIYVDLDGDGFDAPGLPEWWVEPVDPNESTED